MKTAALIAGLLGLGWLATRKPKKKKRPTTAAPKAPAPTPKPMPKPTGNYVGSGWSWPHHDRFPTEQAFGQTLQLLGYDAGGWNSPTYSVLDPQPRQAVRSFQEDFNFIQAYREYMENQGEPPMAGLPPIRARLAEDGLLGPQTIPALVDAFTYQEVAGKSWWQIVDGAQKDLGAAGAA